MTVESAYEPAFDGAVSTPRNGRSFDQAD